MRLPFAPQRAVKRGVILARLVRHGVAQIGFDRALIGADAIDAGVDVEIFEQLPVIEIAAARPGNGRAAQRVDPDLAGMAGEQQGIVGIGGGEAQHRLVRRAHPVDRLADILQMDLSTAEEAVEIEHDRGDPLVAGRRVQRAHEVAGLIFTDRRGTRKQRLERIDRGAFLDHHPVERENQRAFAHLRGAGPRGQHGVEREEEQQHEDEHQPVLDPHQQAPHPACEFHAIVPISLRSSA